jgi:Ca2+-binding RTX toxin-like protein
MQWLRKRLFGSYTKPNRAAQTARTQLAIEGLEDRSVPSTLQIVNGLLTYTASTGVANNLSVAVNSGTYTVTDTAEAINVVGLAGATGSGTNTVTFSAAQVPTAGMVLNLGDMADTVSIVSTTKAISIKAGAGNDTIDVGTFGNGSLNNIQARVTVDGGTGADTLRVNDSASFIDNYTITSTQVLSNGRAVNYSGIENLVVTGALVGDTFTVRSTAAGAQTTLNGGPNGATFNVGGTDGTLDAIQGALTVNGGPLNSFRTSELNVLDQGSFTDHSYTLQANSVTRDGSATISYSGIQDVAVSAGSADDTATVLGTSSLVTLDMGSGNDLVNLGDDTTTMAGIHSLVTVTGADGTDSIVLNDQAATAGNFYSITGTGVMRNFTPLLNYSGAGSLTLSAGSGNDVVSLLSTLATTPVALNMGAGNDLVDIENDSASLADILGTVSVDGQTGTATVFMNDVGETTFHTYTVTANSVSRDGAAVLNYANVAHLEIDAGTANIPIILAFPLDATITGNQFFVQGTSAETTLDLGSEFDVVAVGNDANSLDDIGGALNIVGGGSLALNDQGDTSGQTYTVNANTIARSGAALISYDLGTTGQLFQGLSINAGAFDDTVNLQSTVPTSSEPTGFTPITLNLGAGNDTLNMGGTSLGLSQIGNVQFDGGAGTNAIVLSDDRGGLIGLPTQYVISSSGVTYNGSMGAFFGLSYTNAGSLTINGGAGDDTFFVDSTAATTPVFLNGGRGNDTFALGDNRISASGGPPALFANILGAVTVDGGSGTNTLDYSALPIGVRVNLALGTATGAAGGVRNIQNVSGGQGNDIIVGNDQSNFLFGNGGRDILIGGGGEDLLFAGTGDDILIGDSTVYDTNPAALESLMAEWGRTDLTGTAQDQYNQRINHLLGVTPGGLNGSTKLDLTKVVSDGVEDGLVGNGTGSALDWFFLTGTDGVGNLAPGERIN